MTSRWRAIRFFEKAPAFRIDMWDASGDNLVEHIAGVEDYQVAQATYRAAVERWPGAAITLRQGARVI